MVRGARGTAKAGAISEAAREEEALRYGASLMAESVINDAASPLDSSSLRLSSDAILTAFAQLAALKLNVERAVFSIFDSKRQHIVAEATQLTVITLGPDDSPRAADTEGHALVFSNTAIPRANGACEAVLDLPAVQVSSNATVLPMCVVPDLTQDDRFCRKPYFGADTALRFYAGVPLRTPQGIDIGVCAVFDSKPREGLDLRSQSFLRTTAGLVMSHLQSRVSTESYRRHERMVRGLGSMVEGTGSMSKWRDMPNPESFTTIEGREGGLNAQQQYIQGQNDEFPTTAQLPRPNPVPLQSEPGSTENPEVACPAESTETVASGTTNTATESYPSMQSFASTTSPPKESDDLVITKSLFSRAANIIRESIEVEGALFLDASVVSFGGLVPRGSDSPPPDHDQEHCQSPGSSGDESVGTDDSSTASKACQNLGFSTSDYSSINGEMAPFAFGSVPDTVLERILRRYPRGQVFNFDDDGVVIWAVSDSDESGNSGDADDQVPKPVRNVPNRPRKSDGAFLIRMFPGARSVALIPLWDSHKKIWYAGGFVWTRSRGRVFTIEGELSYLKAFGAAIMSEIARIDVLREKKAKDDVLGSLSHEIRSPLHGVILGVELMHDSVLTSFQEDILHTVETCGRTLLDTLDHLLDFSKVNHFLQSPRRRRSAGHARGLNVGSVGRSIESGMMSIFSEVSLDSLLEEVVESVYAGFSFQNTSSRWASRDKPSTSFFEQGNTLRRLESVRQLDTNGAVLGNSRDEDAAVGIHLNIDPNVSWDFHAQPGALRRIIMNIFGNALKYTSTGSIIVSLTQEPISAKRKSRRRTIVFSVSDSGRGIENEYLQNRLYVPFSQENQMSAGAGLGLSIVKQIVHGLGGRISVESRVAHGTTVKVLLPLRSSSRKPSASGSPHNVYDDLDSLVQRLGGSSVALIGFPEHFDEDHQPLSVEVAKSHVGPMPFLQNMCENYLHLRVLSPLELVSEVPSLVICAERALDQLPALSSQPPVLVACDNALTAHQLTAQHASNTSRIVEFFSQPSRIGPRKLAKILAFALERWKDLQSSAKPGIVSFAPVETSSQDMPILDQESLPEKEKNGFLLVDDNAINLKILDSYMRKLKYAHDTATNGLEAVDACRSREVHYRCIFMDISMPIMDGLEATRLIRAYEQKQQLKPAFIIALTGLASAAKQQEAYASGIDLFLTKPVPLKELGRILEANGM
ncbi:hypothetical protein M406DRAFT_348735 [Cryphonectria parasitica EP155]|uniref:Histidine kinase n=1 Tax=Cryphonectria parasitica (strain ATCC 38755 / EP155) TaxID=660469 RepID=A0A9P4YAG7_CRYP1|nr:uncharacterized protein M406DRAFT_348735 [Cryphonectria parasitica EP155]KAF3769478.1 hypothetical protein M406DRAFT_348735 [Cryphonectria parasitica EP155]